MDVILCITTAFLLAFSISPIVIRVFRSLNMLDNPTGRKIHRISTPSFGGIAIYIAFMMSLLFWVPLSELSHYKFFLLASFFMFLLGLRDDLSSLQALDKLTIQVFAALLIVFFANIRLNGLYGLFGIEHLPAGTPELITIFIIVGLTNAFNLIDGIDGLAGSIALFVCSVLGWWFFSIGQQTLGFMAVSLAAGILAFLFFNWQPSKIFMGDTGSLVIGFILSVLVIQFIDLSAHLPLTHSGKILTPVSMGIALLVLPVYDTFRVFIIRFLAGRSPMSADKNHVHHILLKLGLNHGQATLTLLLFNIGLFTTVWFCQHFGETFCLIIILISALSFGYLLDQRLKRKIQLLLLHKRKTAS